MPKKALGPGAKCCKENCGACDLEAPEVSPVSDPGESGGLSDLDFFEEEDE